MSSFTYSTLGSGLNSGANAMVFDTAGNLWVAGDFTTSGGATTKYLAIWNGSTWSTTNYNFNDRCFALTYNASKTFLYIGGQFTQVGGIAANRIARFNGTTWSALGSGLNAGYCSALAADSLGYVYIGGLFSLAGGVACGRIAYYDGANFFGFGTGTLNGVDNTCFAIAVDSKNKVYVGGVFTKAYGGVNFQITANRIAVSSNRTTFSALGSGLNNTCYALAIDSDDNLYAGGDFTTAGGEPANYIAKWNGTSWSALGTGLNGTCNTITFDQNGNLYAGGAFTRAGDLPANRIAKWNGFTWSALGTGFNGAVEVCLFQSSVNLYIGGGFTLQGGTSNHIALVQEIVPSTSYIYKINNNSVYQCFFPVGCILAYIGTQASGSADYDPDGWLVCDGRTIGNEIPADSKYNALTNFLGSNTLPNLNAAFLRGTGTYDVNRIGPGLKQFQSDSFKSHTHALTYGTISKGGNGKSGSLTFEDASFANTINTYISVSPVDSNTDTRPINYGVKWIIKY